jgi:hypothetical protein
MSITLQTNLIRNGDILHAPVGAEEAVMMSIQAGRYYGLNAAGSRIWELLETPKTVAQICRHICEEFEIDARTCETDVLKFAHELVDNGVVHATVA